MLLACYSICINKATLEGKLNGLCITTRQKRLSTSNQGRVEEV